MHAPIRDHAFRSDCRTAALVTRDGAVDWWPAPRFDAPSAFSAILDDDAGHWALRPAVAFEATRRYRPGTLVLETTMRTGSGTLRISDALRAVERAGFTLHRAAALLAEEVDPRTGEPLGNMPQAIAHIGLANAAQALTEARERVAVRA